MATTINYLTDLDNSLIQELYDNPYFDTSTKTDPNTGEASNSILDQLKKDLTNQNTFTNKTRYIQQFVNKYSTNSKLSVDDQTSLVDTAANWLKSNSGDLYSADGTLIPIGTYKDAIQETLA